LCNKTTADLYLNTIDLLDGLFAKDEDAKPVIDMDFSGCRERLDSFVVVAKRNHQSL
jgi:hypothetical protein